MDKFNFTGYVDTDRLVLERLNDRDFIQACVVNRELLTHICNDDTFKKRLIRYPGIEKYKSPRESWRQFYLRFIQRTSRLREQFKYKYKKGDFERQYQVFKNINPTVNNIFFRAAELGDIDLILEYMPEISPLDGHYVQGQAFVTAVKNNHKDVARVLFGKSQQIFISEAFRNAIKMKNFDMLNFLIELYRSRNTGFSIALREASSLGDIDTVKYLFGLGANIHLGNDTALRAASRAGHLDLVKFLVENGADVTADNNGAAEAAQENEHFNVVNYLVKHGAMRPEEINLQKHDMSQAYF